MKRFILSLLLLVAFAVGFAQAPRITSFTPAAAKPGDVVTLAGTGFNTTAANNVVFFGATRATVTAASTTSLTVTVPIGATYAPITLLNTGTGLACASLTSFNPIYAPAKTNITASDFMAPLGIAAAGRSPSFIAIGDLDGDGKPDLAVVTQLTNTISVYRNTSNSGSIQPGSFAPPVTVASGDQWSSIAIGDLDGDGKPDLAAASPNSFGVSVYRNTSIVGGIAFAPKVDFSTGTEPLSVAIGDLDGDGKPDLALVSYNYSIVSIFRNTSSIGSITVGSFAPSVDFATGVGPTMVAIGDLDGDGKSDLAVATTGSSTVSLFRNTSSSGSITAGSFAPKVDFVTGGAPSEIAIGDLDGDGKSDLAVANVGSNTVSLFRNTSSSGSITAGSFAPKVDFATGVGPESVAIGDLDGDGKPDLAVANASSNSVSVLRNTSNSGSITAGSFASKVDFTVQLGSSVERVAIGDLDGDSRPDLALTDFSAGGVSVFRNSDACRTTLFTSPSITSFTPAAAKPGDLVTLTGTGFNATAANNVVFFGATRATVTAASATSLTVTVPTGATYAPITLLNTGTDLACASLSSFNPIYAPAKTNITASDFMAPVDFSSGGASVIAIGDLDGDGKPDLAVAKEITNSVSVFRNTSANGSITAGSFAPSMNFATVGKTTALAIGDLDGDGKPDLVVGTYFAGNPITTGYTVSVFRNTSSSGSITSGSFAQRVDFATTGGYPRSIAIGDLDGDGKPDLVITNGISSSFKGLWVFRNTSCSGSITSSSFEPQVDLDSISGGGGFYSAALGELDGDSKPDLAVTNVGTPFSVFRNTSSSGSISAGSFGPRVVLPSNALAVAIGDLDGDGKPDLAVTDLIVSNISVFRNTSSSGSITVGSFAPRVDFATGDDPFSIAIGDLDGDGKPDLAVANASSNSVSVLRNTSASGSITAGSFAPKVDFATGVEPWSVAIGDLDGDGKPDLAVANQGSGTVSLLRNADVLPTSSITPASEGTSPELSATAMPNPYADKLNVLVYGTYRGEVMLEVSNLLGQLSEARTVYFDGTAQSVQLGEGLAAGTYYIKVTDAAGQPFTVLKVLKQQ